MIVMHGQTTLKFP